MYTELCRGDKSYAEVGKQFRVSAQRVHQLKVKLDAWYRAQIMTEIGLIQANHTQRLYHVASEEMKAWERSKLDAESETVKDGNGADEDGRSWSETSKTKKGQCGNQAHLNGYKDTLQQIREIWGIDKLEPETGDEVRVAGKTAAEIEQEAKARIDSLLAAIKRGTLN